MGGSTFKWFIYNNRVAHFSRRSSCKAITVLIYSFDFFTILQTYRITVVYRDGSKSVLQKKYDEFVDFQVSLILQYFSLTGFLKINALNLSMRTHFHHKSI